jgi:hypothetical protein
VLKRNAMLFSESLSIYLDCVFRDTRQITGMFLGRFSEAELSPAV